MWIRLLLNAVPNLMSKLKHQSKNDKKVLKCKSRSFKSLEPPKPQEKKNESLVTVEKNLTLISAIIPSKSKPTVLGS